MAPSATSPFETSNEQATLPILSKQGFNGMIAPFPETDSDDLLDLICIGFGPASLAIAIALHDAYRASPTAAAPKVLFLEKQPRFAWHSGMQVAGAKMQISFLKDLATPRDPTSPFTFTNYLHQNGRLNHFINLGTFLPSRVEYEDYLRWCASHFEGCVEYGQDVFTVEANSDDESGKVTSFDVRAMSTTGVERRQARHVVIATGGKGIIPPVFQGMKHVTHSSHYVPTISSIPARPDLKFVVVGSGQSAAEIFNDLWTRFPEAEIRLVIKGDSLRPSDDSPFVNEIFDPDRVDGIYAEAASSRAAALQLNRATNYGVVRLSLLEHIYEAMYMQRFSEPDPSRWRCQILNNKTVTAARAASSSTSSSSSSYSSSSSSADDDVSRLVLTLNNGTEEIEADYVFTATGYQRDAHTDLLGLLTYLAADQRGVFRVARDYRVLLDEGKVSDRAGIWLQGCNEATHGLSDTLLSILAVRGGELVQSIFGKDLKSP
ncbi:L-ornithine 5-monooxygenase [Phlyctema vagabunda]|uniref:L-ornithine N(5)-monooxygenase [NAD(P)H] n=1 Tax=Phlyctema vagabunda TaxID=108571 RepID=A0ABR4P5P6_9HELO